MNARMACIIVIEGQNASTRTDHIDVNATEATKAMVLSVKVFPFNSCKSIRLHHQCRNQRRLGLGQHLRAPKFLRS